MKKLLSILAGAAVLALTVISTNAAAQTGSPAATPAAAPSAAPTQKAAPAKAKSVKKAAQ